MTAEIVIMNKSAVALAADSAVTVSSPSGTKIYNSANKLFMLTKADPVGVMIYGSAHYLGMPWETIIKDFRDSPEAVTHDHLQGYAEAFIRFISTADHLFDPTVASDEALNYIKGYYASVILNEIKHAWNERIRLKGAITETQMKLLARRIIQRHSDECDDAPLLHDVSPGDVARVIREWSGRLTQAIDIVFQQFPLSNASRALLKRLGASLLLREGAWPDSASTGVVVAGFGAQDYFPQSFHFSPRARLNGYLYYTEPTTQEVSKTLAVVQAFAQHEMVTTFLEGIDPRIKSAVTAWIYKVMEGLSTVVPSLAQVTPTVLQDFDKTLNELSAKDFRDDVLGTVAILPKDELAAMAESLVNLTSFKRRVSMAPESVGGPIDVAVVSKGDGFVWIKRKHYFPPELNPHFLARYE